MGNEFFTVNIKHEYNWQAAEHFASYVISHTKHSQTIMMSRCKLEKLPLVVLCKGL